MLKGRKVEEEPPSAAVAEMLSVGALRLGSLLQPAGKSGDVAPSMKPDEVTSDITEKIQLLSLDEASISSSPPRTGQLTRGGQKPSQKDE